MDKRKYFADLLSLYEAAGMGMAGGPEVVPQEQIADTGADVGMGGSGDPAMMGQDPAMQDPNMMGGDPSMMGGAIDPMTGMPMPPPETPEQNLEKEKLKKLYELFEDLLQYGDVFVENIRFVNSGLLDLIRFEKMNYYVTDIKNLLKKINDYLMNIFNKETYDKNLYVYILFRTEFITSIKGLRDILKLEKPDEKFEEK